MIMGSLGHIVTKTARDHGLPLPVSCCGAAWSRGRPCRPAARGARPITTFLTSVEVAPRADGWQISLIEPGNALTFPVGSGGWIVSDHADRHGDTIPVAASGGWPTTRGCEPRSSSWKPPTGWTSPAPCPVAPPGPSGVIRRSVPASSRNCAVPAKAAERYPTGPGTKKWRGPYWIGPVTLPCQAGCRRLLVSGIVGLSRTGSLWPA